MYLYTHPLTLSLSHPLPSHSLTHTLTHKHTIQGMIVKSQAIPAGLPTQFCAAFGAGFFMACTVAPFDMVSTLLSALHYITQAHVCVWKLPSF